MPKSIKEKEFIFFKSWAKNLVKEWEDYGKRTPIENKKLNIDTLSIWDKYYDIYKNYKKKEN
tara:strand:- start:412 stop:597 length:186 start_codon:yes stop_codon:yes gene_type:complete